MDSVKVLYGQTLADIATERLTDLSSLVQLALLNGISITDDLVAGTELLMPVFEKQLPIEDAVLPEKAVLYKTIEVLYGQSLLDIAVHHLGNVNRVLEIVNLNGFRLTEDLAAGDFVKMPFADLNDRFITQLFSDKANAPATQFIDQTVYPGGIDYMQIENDFKVR